ncbi:MAG: glucose-1-phosphate cytidylyltransferase [Rhodospirillaceae bacterium]|nr:MAG: glucose-1-phosphate cytidylyltransferase [Rhodospirillaceae bacterium]
MKAVILAGGQGTRLREETDARPKPMVEIGGRPILWHILKIYAAHGITDFVICLGYRGYMIKEYFSNYMLHMSDVTIDLARNSMEVHHNQAEPWRITLVDTGHDSMTGGRLKRVMRHLGDEPFCMTYGDGVGDIDIAAGIAAFKRSRKLAQVTAVQMPGRFGMLDLSDDKVAGFREKPDNGGWINGGFFVLSPGVERYIDGDTISWEREPMERLAADGQLGVVRHTGFWMPMDTLRDKQTLDQLWNTGHAPWRVW